MQIVGMNSAQKSPMSSNALEPSSLQSDGQIIRILAGKLYDPYVGDLLPNRIISISPQSGLILNVEPFDSNSAPADASLDSEIIDLRDQTVLPGFVDVHVHCE